MAEEQRAEDDESIVLPLKTRLLAGVVALVLLTFCVILIWRGREGGAVIALVITAGVTGLLALIGSLPSRLIVGGNEARWRRRLTEEKVKRKTAEAEVEAVAEELPTEALIKAAVSAGAPQTNFNERAGNLSNLERIAAWRDQAFDALRDASAVINAKLITESLELRVLHDVGTKGDVVRYVPDAVVQRGDRKVYVELFRATSTHKLLAIQRIAERLDAPTLIIATANISPHVIKDETSEKAVTAVVHNSRHDVLVGLKLLLGDRGQRSD